MNTPIDGNAAVLLRVVRQDHDRSPRGHDRRMLHDEVRGLEHRELNEAQEETEERKKCDEKFHVNRAALGGTFDARRRPDVHGLAPENTARRVPTKAAGPKRMTVMSSSGTGSVSFDTTRIASRALRPSTAKS